MLKKAKPLNFVSVNNEVHFSSSVQIANYTVISVAMCYRACYLAWATSLHTEQSM